MYRLTAKVTIRGSRLWVLRHVTEVEIVRDTEQLTDVCRLTMPKLITWDGKKEIPVRRGDAITVELGYDDNLQVAFSGYVREVGFKRPVVLTCEDEMYRLKGMATNKKAYRNVDIETLLKDQGLTNVRVFGEQRLGQFRVTDNTVAALLARLKQSGVRSFFRQEDGKAVLYCGVIFDREDSQCQVLETGRNIIADTLKQQKADDMRINLKAVSLMPNGKKVKIELGDKDGERRTVHAYNKSEAELKAWAQQELDRLKQDGLTGTVTTFGYKLLEKLDTVGMKIEGVKMGRYQVKKNTIKYGQGGFRQEITLGERISV